MIMLQEMNVLPVLRGLRSSPITALGQYGVSFDGHLEARQQCGLRKTVLALQNAVNCAYGEHPGRGLEFSLIDDFMLILICRGKTLRIESNSYADMNYVYAALSILAARLPKEVWADADERKASLGRIHIRRHSLIRKE
jgi:hypothetical protein